MNHTQTFSKLTPENYKNISIMSMCPQDPRNKISNITEEYPKNPSFFLNREEIGSVGIRKHKQKIGGETARTISPEGSLAFRTGDDGDAREGEEAATGAWRLRGGSIKDDSRRAGRSLAVRCEVKKQAGRSRPSGAGIRV